MPTTAKTPKEHRLYMEATTDQSEIGLQRLQEKEIAERTVKNCWGTELLAPAYWTYNEIDKWNEMVQSNDMEIVLLTDFVTEAAKIINGEKPLDYINNLDYMPLQNPIASVDELIQMEKEHRNSAYAYFKNVVNNQNPWFERLSDAQKEAVLNDMRTNPDLIGEYQDELRERRYAGEEITSPIEWQKPEQKWLLDKINYRDSSGEFPYFSENNEAQKRHYGAVFSEDRKMEKQKISTTSLAQDIIAREKRKEQWRISHGKALPTDEIPLKQTAYFAKSDMQWTLFLKENGIWNEYRNNPTRADEDKIALNNLADLHGTPWQKVQYLTESEEKSFRKTQDIAHTHILTKADRAMISAKITARKNLLSWANEAIFDEADGMDGADIFQKYDNAPISIAVLSEKAMAAFQHATDKNIYSGKAYFIDHMVNHHSELDISEYENFQDDLDNFNKAYSDPKNGSIVFERDKNNKKYSIAIKEDERGNLLFYKSYHYGEKTKKRFIELDLEKLAKEKASVEVGKSPISHSEKTEPGRPLSALPDVLTIAQSNKKSSTAQNDLSQLVYKHANIDVDGKVRECKTGLLDGFKNAVRSVERQNKTIDALIKENERLQNKLNQTRSPNGFDGYGD